MQYIQYSVSPVKVFAYMYIHTVTDYRRATCSGSKDSPTGQDTWWNFEYGVGYIDTWGREGSTDDV